MDVRILDNKVELGQQAAAWCAGILQKAIRDSGSARLILATGASQLEFLNTLVSLPVTWNKVTCFHLDEYLDLDKSHPASFRKYLNDHVWERVSPKMAAVYPLDPNDIEGYAALISAAAIDLACIGIGENGHIAFNDPHVADFDDPKVVKVVTLDDACRQQQVGEGWFPTLQDTPTQAATLTIPTILGSKVISVVVPDQRKAQAVLGTLTGPVSTSCPASSLQKHHQVVLWLDQESSSLYKQHVQKAQHTDRKEVAVPFPGIVDLQVNGYKGVDFSSPSLTEEAFREACHSLLHGAGVIIFLPTLITCSIQTYEHNLPIIAHVLQTDKTLSKHIPGIHLEGPFLCPQPGACGCHDSSKMIPPNLQIFDYLQECSNGLVKMMTIAADQPNADVLTAYATAQGVCVSLGHHLATCREISKMAAAGAKMLTHLGNGLPELIHRHSNPIMAGLSHEGLKIGIVADGHHLTFEVLKVFIMAKDTSDIILVSDASPLSGLSPGDYTIHDGVRVVLERSGKLKQRNTTGFAGTSSTILHGANYLLTHGLANLKDLHLMAYKNPLWMIGLDPDTVAKHFQSKLHFQNQCLVVKK